MGSEAFRVWRARALLTLGFWVPLAYGRGEEDKARLFEMLHEKLLNTPSPKYFKYFLLLLHRAYERVPAVATLLPPEEEGRAWLEESKKVPPWKDAALTLLTELQWKHGSRAAQHFLEELYARIGKARTPSEALRNIAEVVEKVKERFPELIETSEIERILRGGQA